MLVFSPNFVVVKEILAREGEPFCSEQMHETNIGQGYLFNFLPINIAIEGDTEEPKHAPSSPDTMIF